MQILGKGPFLSLNEVFAYLSQETDYHHIMLQPEPPIIDHFALVFSSQRGIVVAPVAVEVEMIRCMMIETSSNVSNIVTLGTLRRHVGISMVVLNKSFRIVPSKDLFLVVMVASVHRIDSVLILSSSKSSSTLAPSSDSLNFSRDEIEALHCFMASIESSSSIAQTSSFA